MSTANNETMLIVQQKMKQYVERNKNIPSLKVTLPGSQQCNLPLPLLNYLFPQSFPLGKFAPRGNQISQAKKKKTEYPTPREN